MKAGSLCALTETIALAEASVVVADVLAIDEINAAGAVAGKKTEPAVGGGASEWPALVEQAKKLVERDNVAGVFGCFTLASPWARRWL